MSRRFTGRSRKRRPRVYGAGCHGKVRYRDHLEAHEAIRVLAERSGRAFVPARSYPCDVCHGWHITST
jgi:hypothetical protein